MIRPVILCVVLVGSGCAAWRGAPVSRDDVIRFGGTTNRGDLVVVSSGRNLDVPADCVEHRIERLDDGIWRTGYRSEDGCRNEVLVFGRETGFTVLNPDWTDDDDSFDVELPPRRPLEITVWIAIPDGAPDVIEHVDYANEVFRKNRAGIEVRPTMAPESADVAARAAIGRGCEAVDRLLEAHRYFTRGRINVYYVIGEFRGVTCEVPPERRAEVIYVGRAANRATLVHELGHALGLRPAEEGGHTNGLRDFDARNVMWSGGGPERDHFSLGQVFRMNVHVGDGVRPAANVVRLPEDAGRKCAPADAAPGCPPLSLGRSESSILPGPGPG